MTELEDGKVAPIVSMVTFTVLAGAVFLVLPLVLGALIDIVGLTASQAGWVAAAEMFGASIAALGVSLIISQGRWRAILLAGTVLLALADAVSPLVHDFRAWVTARLIAGLGEGGLLAIANASIGETRNPDRIFGFQAAGQLVFGAVGLYVMPSILPMYGVRGVFWTLSTVTFSAMTLGKYMPDRARSSCDIANHALGTILSRRSVIGLLGVFTSFVAQGGVWAYLDRIGAANRIEMAHVAFALATSSVAGFLGATLASWLDVRYGRLKPLVICTFCTIVSLLVLIEAATFTVFATMTSLFNFAWNASTPYQFGTLAEIDPSRRTVSVGGAVVFAGLTVGPAIAASIVTGGGYQYVGWMGVAFCIVSIIFFGWLLVPIELPKLQRP